MSKDDTPEQTRAEMREAKRRSKLKKIDPSKPLANPRHELVAKHYAKNGVKAEAVRQAGMTDDSGTTNRLFKREEMDQRIAYIREQALATKGLSTVIDPDMIVGNLADLAMSAKSEGARVKASELLGKSIAGGGILLTPEEKGKSPSKEALITMLEQLGAPKEWLDQLKVKLGMAAPPTIDME